MTDRQINHTIAVRCGTWMLHEPGWIRAIPNPNRPDYVNDQNAMHDAESEIGKSVSLTLYYMKYLQHHGSMQGIHATSRQRAEAFIYAINYVDESHLPTLESMHGITHPTLKLSLDQRELFW